MSQGNNQSSKINNKQNLTTSVKTSLGVDGLNIPQLPDKNEEDKKEDLLMKNNNSGNQMYVGNNNGFGDNNFFKKLNSAEITNNNNLDQNNSIDDDDNSIDEDSGKVLNMLAQKDGHKSKKNDVTKSQNINLYNTLKKNINNNQFSIIQNKNENSFTNLDNNDNNKNDNNNTNNTNNNNYINNNNTTNDIKHSKTQKNPIFNIIPRLNQQTNEMEQLRKDLFARKDNNVKKCCLENYGDTSYLNTILQSLANIENLKNFFLNENIKNYLITNLKTLPLSFVTQRIFEHFYVKKDSKYTLDSFIRVLGNLNHIYSSTKSRNANECLMFILDSLHNELNRIREINQKNDFDKKERKEVISYGIMNYKNQYDCIISDNFNWQELKELHCTECGERSYDFKTYNTFQLDCLDFKKTIDKNIINIYDCLEYELNITKKAFCCYCRKKADIKSISGIYSSPRIFVFLLNSGNFDENLLNLNFKLETVINLKNFIENKKSPIKYDLVGVISMDIRNKKYINYCKSFEDQQWYFYWEENIAQITEKQVILDNSGKFTPSVLFYKSIN